MSPFAYALTYGVCSLYLIHLLRLVRKGQINLLDFFFTSLIGVVPPLYITFYGSIAAALAWIGIQTPFLVFFAGFFVLVFLYVTRIVILLHHAEKNQVRLVEEVALLTERLERRGETD